VSVRVVDTDKGLRALLKRLHDTHGRVAIGVLGPDAAKAHDDVTMYDVAAYNEFGTSRIPERSFLRDTVDIERAKIVAFARKQSRSVLEGKMDGRTALERLGLMTQGLIQARIAAGIEPENKPATVAAKKSSKPLIATGQLRASISYEVRP